MESVEHFFGGVIASAVALSVFTGELSSARLALLFGYGAALSVFIDLDHFVLARRIAGDWRHLRGVLADPTNAMRGQKWIFEDIDGMEFDRLLSHMFIGGALTVGLFAVSVPAAVLTAVVVYVHVVCDLLRDGGMA